MSHVSFNFLLEKIMKRIVSSFAMVLTMLMASSALAQPTSYRSTMSGPSEQPPNTSPGASIATVVVDTLAQTMTFSVPFIDLVSPTVAGHLHCCTPEPLTGIAPVAIPFDGFPTGVREGLYDRVFSLTDPATYDPAFITAHGGTVDAARDALLAGVVNNFSYNNLHTVAYPAGEIRGFLVALAVPEPSTWLMLGVGLAGLGLCAARKRAG